MKAILRKPRATNRARAFKTLVDLRSLRNLLQG